MGRRDDHVIEDAKSHGTIPLRVMSWRSYGTEGIVRIPCDHGIHGGAHTAYSPQRCLARGRAQGSVGVKEDLPFARHAFQYLRHIGGIMGALDDGTLGNRGFMTIEGGEIIVLQHRHDGTQPARKFRMHGAGIMVDADRMGKQTSFHERGLFSFFWRW